MPFTEFFNGIYSGVWKRQVSLYQRGRLRKQYLPCVTPSGVFAERCLEGMLTHSGLINIDIDENKNVGKNLIDYRGVLYSDPYIYAGHCSVSGRGLSLYIKIDANKHTSIFNALGEYFRDNYRLNIDLQCCDFSRLRTVSYDRDAFLNTKSTVWTLTKDIKIGTTNKCYTNTFNKVLELVEYIRHNKIDITGDYNDWIRVGFALCTEFGELGREYFHIISSQSRKYNINECDKKYNSLLKNNKGVIRIGTLFYIASKAGISNTKT